MDVVTVECDRCRRPGWQLVSAETGEVYVDGARIGGGDGSPYWAAVLGAQDAHRYRAGDGRPGAFIIPADNPEDPAAPYGERCKLVCIGRRHPRYERVVTSESASRAYHAAAEAGRTRIGLRDIA